MMGKRSKERKHLDVNGTDPEEGLCGIPNNTLGKKRKKKIFQDVDNPEICSSDGFPEGDTEVRSHKKKNKNNLDDYNVSEQVAIKHKKKKNKESHGIGEDTNLNSESNSFALINDRSHKKKKKRKSRIELEVEAEGNSNESEHLKGNKSHKNNVTKPQENQIEISSESLTKKKKKKVAVETEEEIESNNECFNAENIENSKTKKKLEINFNDLNQSIEERYIKKKKKVVAETVEPTNYNSECIDVEHVDNNSKTKKKKKKHQEQDETINDLNQIIEGTNTENKKKKNKGIEGKLSADSVTQKTKPVTAKFNAEEAAVTEEEINQFCDEIDEEDNKQYEEWVDLLEAMLGPKKTHVN